MIFSPTMLNPNKKQFSNYSVSATIELSRPFFGFPIEMFANTTPTFYPAVWFETITKQPEDFSPTPPSSSTIPSPTTGPGCFGVPLKFNVASSNFAESKLVCYDKEADGGVGVERLPDDETMVSQTL